MTQSHHYGKGIIVGKQSLDKSPNQTQLHNCCDHRAFLCSWAAIRGLYVGVAVAFYLFFDFTMQNYKNFPQSFYVDKNFINFLVYSWMSQSLMVWFLVVKEMPIFMMGN